MVWRVSKILTLLAVLAFSVVAEEDEEEAAYSEASEVANSEDERGGEDISGASSTPSSVYVCWLEF